LLRFLEEGQVLNAATETEIKSCVDDKRRVKVKLTKGVKEKLEESIEVVYGWLKNL